MKYIIADPDEQSSSELKQILDGFEMLEFQGSFTTLEATENSIREKPPDIAFIRRGTAELNAFRLPAVIQERKPVFKSHFHEQSKRQCCRSLCV